MATQTSINTDLSPEEVERRLKEFERLHNEEEMRAREAAKTAAENETRYYRSVIPSINFIFPSGKAAIFVKGVYKTNMENEIECLDREVKLGHPHIQFMTAEEAKAAPLAGFSEEILAGMRAYFFQEFLDMQNSPKPFVRDMGTSDQSRVRPASSMDVATAMAGGSGKTIADPRILAALQSLQTIKLDSGQTKTDLVPVITNNPQGNSDVPKLTELTGTGVPA